MTKPQTWQVLIEVEMARLREFGVPPHIARVVTVIRWINQGDLRPLADFLNYAEMGEPMRAVGGFLIELIENDRLLVMKPKRTGRSRRGAEQKPEAWARDFAITYALENGMANVGQLAKLLNVSEKTVEAARAKAKPK